MWHNSEICVAVVKLLSTRKRGPFCTVQWSVLCVMEVHVLMPFDHRHASTAADKCFRWKAQTDSAICGCGSGEIPQRVQRPQELWGMPPHCLQGERANSQSSTIMPRSSAVAIVLSGYSFGRCRKNKYLSCQLLLKSLCIEFGQ